MDTVDPERLDERKPERGERSLFERLFGRESEEAKLRRKLDEELKAAARTRAEHFEEERRLEEKREVAETRKLKKRWRAKLVEKSEKLLRETAQNGEEPTGGLEIAKVMVAERIVKLHAMLNDESLDLRRSEIKNLKIHIDFMGLLSEKLDRPELEVPEEVEQLYATIAASVEETTGETFPETTLTATKPETPAIPTAPEDAAYAAFAANIVQAIKRVWRPENQPKTDSVGGSATATQSPQPAKTAELWSTIAATAQPAEAMRRQIADANTARRLTNVVEKATTINRLPFLEAAPTTAPNRVKDTRSAAVETVAVQPKRSEFPDKKVKFWSEVELLARAAQIDAGSGRRVSDLYKRGEVDREGLVKIIESYNKGLDFRSEIVRRRFEHRQRSLASPEFDAQPPGAQPAQKPAVPQQPPKTSSRPSKLAAAKGKLRNIGRALPKISTTSKEARRLAREASERLARQSRVTLVFTAVLLVVLISFVVIELSGL